MPDYYPIRMSDLPDECQIHPDDSDLPLSCLLRQRLMYTNPENQDPGTLQVAQRGEFRYIGRGISPYLAPMGQIEHEKAQK